MEHYGLLGEKLGHSLSPEIHHKILKSINKDGEYKLFEIEKNKLSQFINEAKILKVKGFNVTIPYKQDIIEYLDYVSDEALRIGAVNTVLNKDGKLFGYNTDYYGFGATFKRRNISFKDKTVVILGAGGACKAALAYILDNEVKSVYIVSRNPSNTKVTIKDDRIYIIDYEKLYNIKGDILINSTPVGMYPNISNAPVDEDIVKNFDVIMDLIYNPLETNLIKYGVDNEKITLDGLYMLVGQAVKAQEIFQQHNIDLNIVETIYDEIKVRFK